MINCSLHLVQLRLKMPDQLLLITLDLSNLIDHITLPTVEYFSILDSLHLSDFGVHNICCSFPNLVCLCLRGSLAITNKSLGIIVSALRKLQSLQISSCKNILSNLSSKKQLLPLQYVLKRIKRLDISGNDHFEDELFLSTFVRVRRPTVVDALKKLRVN